MEFGSFALNKQESDQGGSEQTVKPDKKAYLESQVDSVVVDPSFMNSLNSFQNSCAKEGTIKRKINQGEVPSKFSYISLNSSSKQDSEGRQEKTGERSIQATGIENSDVLIDRLNSKLSIYIKEHKLRDDEELSSWRSSEGTHRQMHMSFNELKKHGQFMRK